MHLIFVKKKKNNNNNETTNIKVLSLFIVVNPFTPELPMSLVPFVTS